MGKHRKRVKPLVPPGKAPSQAAAPVTSLKLARKLTSKFHSLQNEETALKLDKVKGAAEKANRLRGIQAEMDAMGGRAAYQEASALSTKAFRSSRVVFKTLIRLGMQPSKGQRKLQVLEIGAVNGQLAVCPWMDVRAIDIRSRDPHVEERDFFDVPVADASPKGDRGQYDVVVNAMVVNCMGDPVQRAECLVRCRDHLRPGGVFFFAVPSRCIDMSQHLTRPMLETFLSALGFSTLDEKRTPKISFYILRRDDVVAPKEGGAGQPAAAAAAAAAPSSAGAPTGADSAKAAGAKRKRTDGEGGTGGAYRPLIRIASDSDASLLARLSPPVRLLPKGEMPLTGFTLTDFALAVPQEWVKRVPASALPARPPAVMPPKPVQAGGAAASGASAPAAGKPAAAGGKPAAAGGKPGPGKPAGGKPFGAKPSGAKPHAGGAQVTGKAAPAAAGGAAQPAAGGAPAAAKPKALPKALVAAAAADPTLAAELGRRSWGPSAHAGAASAGPIAKGAQSKPAPASAPPTKIRKT